jgi:hypothetical protein
MKKFLPVLGLACLLGLQTTAAQKPNIGLILADDFGYKCVTANGGQSYQTPNSTGNSSSPDRSHRRRPRRKKMKGSN